MRAQHAFLPLALLAAACASTQPAADHGAGAPAQTTTTTVSAKPAQAEGPTAHVELIAFSDFHGWLLPLEPKGFSKYYGGIAHIAAMISGKEKLDGSSAIIVDNGDMWTGPTESTILRGEPVIQAYNRLGLSAANIANHEFDFGTEVLKARIGEAKFPFLGANIVKAGTTESASFVKPFTIVTRGGIKVGIIGLSFADTPRTTLAKHVAGLEFRPYKETLQRVVPEARKAGAEVIVVLFHDTVDEIKKVMEEVKDLEIAAVVAGQNHRKEDAQVGPTPIVNPGPFGRSYAHFTIEVDRATKKVLKTSVETVDVEGEVGAPKFPPSADMIALVEAARQKASQMSGELVGKLAKPLPVGTFADSPLGHMIADAWLAALPHADFAICNHGAIRQPLAAGPVTIGDILSVLPFENNLYVVKLSGRQLKDQLAIDGPVVAGMTWRYKEDKKGRSVVAVLDRMGKPIDDKKTYSVVIIDFMYFGGDGFRFKDFDASPDDSGLSLREPVMRTLRAAETMGRAVEPSPGARAAKAK